MEETAREKGEFTIEDLTEKWNSKFEGKKSSFALRRWVGYLCDIGYLTSKPDQTDKRRRLYETIHDSQKTCKYLNRTTGAIFKLEMLKAWLKEAEKIFAHNTLSLRENIISKREITIEELYNRHFLSETSPRANIPKTKNQGFIGEKGEEKASAVQCKHLQDFKAVYWSEGFYGWHPCAVCGYTKLTSYKAETFKGEGVWLCEDYKEKWEKQQTEA